MIASKIPTLRALLALSALGCISPASALTITLDYTYDSNNFFGNASAKTALEAARNYYQSRIDQSFSAITPGGSNTWTANPFDPRDVNQSLSISNLSIAADTVVIYVGGYNLGGSTLGIAGRGGYSYSGSGSFGSSVTRGDSASQ